MSFLQIDFIIVLAAAVIFYYIVPVRIRWLILLAFSCYFYCTWGYASFLIMLLTAFAAWFAALRIGKRYLKLDKELKQYAGEDKEWKRNKKTACRKGSRRWLAAAVLLLLMPLVGVKYLTLRSFSIIVPLGISYYTLSLIAYLADVYWRKVKPETNLIRFLLFVSFFPKILQGPIVKYQDISEQLCRGHRFDYSRMCRGLQRILTGCLKKMVIADRLNIFVQSVFHDYNSYSGSVIMVGAFFGAFQLYCDFSGCMDMAQGISNLFGIELTENFRRPFLSETASEFWRRWHITLGVWFRDYIYMPLVAAPGIVKFSGVIRKRFGKRAGRLIITGIPLFTVWLLTGLWHGTGWNYVVWGCYWGVIIFASTALEPQIRKLSKKTGVSSDHAFGKHIRRIRTFLLFCFARLLTLPGSLQDSARVIQKLVTGFHGWSLVNGDLYCVNLDRSNFLFALACLVILMGIELLEESRGAFMDVVAQQHIIVRWIIYQALILTIVIFGIYGPGFDAAGFVYMRY